MVRREGRRGNIQRPGLGRGEAGCVCQRLDRRPASRPPARRSPFSYLRRAQLRMVLGRGGNKERSGQWKRGQNWRLGPGLGWRQGQMKGAALPPDLGFGDDVIHDHVDHGASGEGQGVGQDGLSQNHGEGPEEPGQGLHHATQLPIPEERPETRAEWHGVAVRGDSAGPWAFYQICCQVREVVLEEGSRHTTALSSTLAATPARHGTLGGTYQKALQVEKPAPRKGRLTARPSGKFWIPIPMAKFLKDQEGS